MISEYEQRRNDNIQRNNAYLKEIGLESAQYRQRRNAAKKTAVKKRPRVESEENDYPVAVRRSSRVASLPPVSYKEEQILLERANRSSVDVDDVAAEPEDLEIGNFAGLERSHNADLDLTAGLSNDLQSVANLNANYQLFLTTYLCKPVDDYGKLAVMTLSNNGRTPKFNKYPGVIEWKNCLYLWVNIGGKSGYTNTFTEKGRHMMWYGGSKMKPDSRVTLRLIHPNNNKSSNSNVTIQTAQGVTETTSDESIAKEQNPHRTLLFVRMENANYCCLGEVKYIAVDLLADPIKIKWELSQFDQISSSEYFQQVLIESHYK